MGYPRKDLYPGDDIGLFFDLLQASAVLGLSVAPFSVPRQH